MEKAEGPERCTETVTVKMVEGGERMTDVADNCGSRVIQLSTSNSLRLPQHPAAATECTASTESFTLHMCVGHGGSSDGCACKDVSLIHLAKG